LSTKKKKENNEENSLSDSRVEELYSQYIDKEKNSTRTSQLKEKTDDFVEQGSKILKTGEELSSSALGTTVKELKNLGNDITKQKPHFNNMKSKTSEQLNEFSKKSSTTIKNAQSSLKGFGTKFFGKTKKEISEGTDYFEKNIPTLKNKLNEEFREGTDSVQKNAPKIGKKIKGSFLDTIEKTHGASSKGKQYGTQSASMIKQIGELKEAGLITEKEYLQKKKELLSKI
jgi:hypothetical protein